MPYVMDMTEKDITLPEFTAKAVENTISFDNAIRVAVDFAGMGLLESSGKCFGVK